MSILRFRIFGMCEPMALDPSPELGAMHAESPGRGVHVAPLGAEHLVDVLRVAELLGADDPRDGVDDVERLARLRAEVSRMDLHDALVPGGHSGGAEFPPELAEMARPGDRYAPLDQGRVGLQGERAEHLMDVERDLFRAPRQPAYVDCGGLQSKEQLPSQPALERLGAEVLPGQHHEP